ncbi:MAG: hypothetical protein NUV69_01995 [Candidatus Curtissbacteria bacterium]|nr:hypothetical protein [Candidatus Curtissbacteria bacterium]
MKDDTKIEFTNSRNFSEIIKIPRKIIDLSCKPLWSLNITQLAGHNIESEGRKIVNSLLQNGWVLLYIYTLKYKVNRIWRERPMAILGKPGGQGKVRE